MCERDSDGNTGRDLAMKKSNMTLVQAIDSVVEAWIEGSGNKRRALLLGGYRTFSTSVLEKFSGDLFEFEVILSLASVCLLLTFTQ